MGKRPLVRRRGRGGNQFRSTSTGKVGSKANYPRFSLSEQHDGKIIDLVHERGREAPLAKIRFEDGSVSYVPAVLGTKVGITLQFGTDADAFIAAQAAVAVTETTLTDLEAAKEAFDAINAVDDGLTPLEATATTAAGNVDSVTLADGTNAMTTDDVAMLTALVAGDVSDISDWNDATDSVYVGTGYTVNTGAVTTGDDAVLEMFITEGTTAADTLLTFETEVFGSSSVGDFFTVELTGVVTADVSVVDGLLTVA